jgi:hypothetical protein
MKKIGQKYDTAVTPGRGFSRSKEQALMTTGRIDQQRAAGPPLTIGRERNETAGH